MLRTPPTTPHAARGLADAGPAEERERAERASVAPSLWWQPGRPPEVPPGAEAPGGLGLLVLRGTVALRVERDGRARAELLGPEDLLRPWVAVEEHFMTPTRFHWEVLEPVQLAVLGREVAGRLGRWPEIASALLDREVLRSRRLAVQMTAAAEPRGERRVLHLLRQLAERWGRVTPDGVVVPVPLTHRLIGELTGSRRPTVTTALARLRRDGVVTPLPGHRHLLVEDPSARPDR